jgi:signal transduction histidine kinase/CheY-like chemotaxis protein
MNSKLLSYLLTLFIALALNSIVLANPENLFLKQESTNLSKNYIHYQYADTASEESFLSALFFCEYNKKLNKEVFINASLTAEVMSGFNDNQACINYADIALLAADSMQLSFNEKKHLLQLKSNALENLNKSDESLDLWREILKNGEDLNDVSISYNAIYNLIRIYNNQNNSERARIYADIFHTESVSNLSGQLKYQILIELIRLSIHERSFGNAVKYFSILHEQSNLESELTELEIFLKQFLLANTLGFNDQVINNLTDIIAHKQVSTTNLFVKSDAAVLLGNFYIGTNPEKASEFLLKASSIDQAIYERKVAFSSVISNAREKLEIIYDSFNPPDKSKSNLGLIVVAISTLLLILFAALVIRKTISFKRIKEQAIINLANDKLDLDNRVNHLDSDLENQISDRVDTLTNEINERARIDEELKDALQKAERANFLKNAFLGNMSHEIRTPLNGILGFSSLLETELALLENTDLYEYANSIQKSGERLLHLLNNIIDISRLEANDIEMNIMACDLSEIIDNVIETNKFRANDKGLKIVKDIKPSVILADKPTLIRVLNELVDNALKYTEKGFIKITVSINSENNKAIIIIKDSGIGIDSNYLPHIFEAFRQESLGYTRQYQGAGLGIPLAKRLIDKMGGSFKLNSEKSIGTEITIDFPLNNETKIKGEFIENESAETLLKGKKVLILEDDLASRTILTKIIQKIATVIEAKNGDEAINLVHDAYKEQELFDLMLFDINLPAPWDGIKLMVTIKDQIEEYKNIPFIAQTAYGMLGDKERIMEAGFDGYVSKPVNRKEMFDEICRVVKK